MSIEEGNEYPVDQAVMEDIGYKRGSLPEGIPPEEIDGYYDRKAQEEVEDKLVEKEELEQCLAFFRDNTNLVRRGYTQEEVALERLLAEAANNENDDYKFDKPSNSYVLSAIEDRLESGGFTIKQLLDAYGKIALPAAQKAYEESDKAYDIKYPTDYVQKTAVQKDDEERLAILSKKVREIKEIIVYLEGFI